jgi:hypothetical protein
MAWVNVDKRIIHGPELSQCQAGLLSMEVISKFSILLWTAVCRWSSSGLNSPSTCTTYFLLVGCDPTIFCDHRGSEVWNYWDTFHYQKQKKKSQFLRAIFSRFFHGFLVFATGRAVAQAVSRWLPTAAARCSRPDSMWGLSWTKRHWGRFSPSTSVSPANHSTNFSIVIITWGWHTIGHWWPQCWVDPIGLHPPLYQFK